MESVREWVVDVENKVEKMEVVSKDSELEKNRCFYKIPNDILELDKKAYMPQVVSLGPYHHDDNLKLEAMEKHKDRALLHFLKRSGKKLTEYCNALEKEVKNLKEAFEHPESLGDDGEFVQMMILDGCFILEILRTAGGNALGASIFSGHGSFRSTEMSTISRDMLLLENQVPLRILEILVDVEGKEKDKHAVINSILRFFDLARRSQSMDKQGCLHVLDVCRRGLLVEPPKNKTHNKKMSLATRCGHSPCCGSLRSVLGLGIQKPLESECETDIIPSATELHEDGIRFLPSKTTSLMVITFNGSTLRVRPIVVVADDTKSFFLNLMAFERMHESAGNEVTSYVYFMGCLIKSDRDARLLRSVGIVPGALGSDEDVAQLFRSISKYAMLNPKYSELVRDFQSMTKKLGNRITMNLNAWRIDHLKEFLKSPSGVVSVFSTLMIVYFIGIQTFIAILNYKNSK